MSGSWRDDLIRGFGGNDTIDGNAGDDTLTFGTSTGTAHGGDGNDWINLGRTWDVSVYGGAGNDRVDGPLLRVFDGGAGDDILNMGGVLAQQVDLLDGFDILDIETNYSSYFTGGVALDATRIVNFEKIILSPSAQITLSDANIGAGEALDVGIVQSHVS
jgi:Ca2+-binding RTX toxin-like protein